jgi:hypothetical protein
MYDNLGMATYSDQDDASATSGTGSARASIGACARMRTLLAIGTLALLAAGCASFDGYGLKPGQATGADVERAMGMPAETRKVGDETLLYYPRQPFGAKTFVARIGQGDRLIDIEQRLTDDNVAKIIPNVTTATQVRDLLGPPWETSHDPLTNRTACTWYMYVFGDPSLPVELDVQMSPDGVVREVYKLDTGKDD